MLGKTWKRFLIVLGILFYSIDRWFCSFRAWIIFDSLVIVVNLYSHTQGIFHAGFYLIWNSVYYHLNKLSILLPQNFSSVNCWMQKTKQIEQKLFIDINLIGFDGFLTFKSCLEKIFIFGFYEKNVSWGSKRTVICRTA